MSCRPLDVESFRNRARLPKGITRRKRAGYDESKKVSRTLLVDDIFGKVRVLAWFAASAPPTFASDFSALMHQKLGVYWADLWVASGASEADRKVYDELWEASNERAPSLRLSERIRSHGFWMKPPSDPAWQVSEDHPPVIGFYSFKGNTVQWKMGKMVLTSSGFGS